jgi:RNA polymerase sigma factor (sigma-70 family)
VTRELEPTTMGVVRPRVRREGSAGDSRTGDLQALYVATYPMLVRTLRCIVDDRSQAEDIVQEAFVQLVRHWNKVSAYDEPGAWLRRVAIRMAVKESRRSRLRPVRERQSQPPPPEVPAVSDPALLAAVRELPARQRAVVALFYLEDRPMEQVAELLGCSQSTGWVHLHRARRALAERLGEEVPVDVD